VLLDHTDWIKLADWGYARSVVKVYHGGPAEHLADRPYLAPELLISDRHYSTLVTLTLLSPVYLLFEGESNNDYQSAGKKFLSCPSTFFRSTN